MDSKERIDQLTDQLKEAGYRYYVLDDPTMNTTGSTGSWRSWKAPTRSWQGRILPRNGWAGKC